MDWMDCPSLRYKKPRSRQGDPCESLLVSGARHGRGARAAFTLLTVLVVAGGRAQPVPAEVLAQESFLFTPPGFASEGKPMWASGAQTGELEIVVRDAASGEVTPCRINVVGPDGNFYQPAADRLSNYALTGQWPNPGPMGNPLAWGNRVGKAP